MRKTTITVPQNQVSAHPVERKEVIHEDRVDHSKLALWIGAFAAMGALGIVILIVYLFPAVLREWPILVVFVLAAGLLTSAYFGVNWLRVAAVRLWSVDDEERQHRYWLESLEVEDPEPVIVDTSALMLVGYKLLRLHYVESKECTRPECEKIGIDQRDWNRVNQLLKLLAIKSDRKWVEPDYIKAVEKWEEVTINVDGTATVQVAKNHWERIKLDL